MHYLPETCTFDFITHHVTIDSEHYIWLILGHIKGL